jgi:hypothetical protein
MNPMFRGEEEEDVPVPMVFVDSVGGESVRDKRGEV